MENSETGLIQEGQNPLLNIHVVEKILKHCTKLSTLLHCRLVCQSWNKEVLRILKRNRTTVELKGREIIQEFVNFNGFSDDAPFTSYSIELPSKTPDNLIVNVLTKIQYSAKHLKLEYDPLASSQLNQEESEEEDKEQLDETLNKDSEIVFTLLPNLESIHLFSTNIFPPQSPDGLHQLPTLFDTLLTPSLTSLSVQHMYDTDCSKTAIKLINSSQRKLSCLKFPCNEFSKIISHVSLCNLKELDICDLFHGSFSTNQTIECIINACPKLEKLSLELGFRVTPECVFKLFQTLSTSLVSLRVIIQDKNLLSRTVQRVNFNFPYMPLLNKLFLRYTNPGLVYFINQMPKLRSLKLETPWTRKVRGSIFPGVVSVYNNLHTLNLSEKLTVRDIQSICKLFPNLKSLCASFESNEVIREVFQSLTNLESFIIDRNSCVSDCGLCGMSDEDLKELERDFLKQDMNCRIDFEADQLESSPRLPSIRCLKNLKELKLVQAGLTWRSLVFGVASKELEKLQSLAVQTTTLKIVESIHIIEDSSVLNLLSKRLMILKQLTLWIRRNMERLHVTELQHLNSFYLQWNIEVAIQTACSNS